MVKALIATLGFDERHVLRSLLSIGMAGVKEIALLVPSWGIEERTRKAIEEIKRIASIAGISEKHVKVYDIDVEDFWKSVGRTMAIIRDLYISGVDEIVLSLGGGLRALVLEAYTAAILLPKRILEKITIRIDIETKGEGPVIKGVDIPLCVGVTQQEKTVLEKLLERKTMTFREIVEETGIPRSTIWKILRKLIDKKLVEKIRIKYKPTPMAEILMKIYSQY